MGAFIRTITTKAARAAALALSACLLAAAPATAFELEAPNGEKLTVDIPDGFFLAYEADEPGTMYEFIPDGETVTGWSDMITLIRFPGNIANELGLKKWAEINAIGFLSDCKTKHFRPVAKETKIGSAEAAYFSGGCITKEALRRKVIMDVRAHEFLSVTYIQGKEHFYALQRAIHFDELGMHGGTTLDGAIARHEENLAYTKSAMTLCCGE